MKLKNINKKYQIYLLIIAIMLIISGVSYAYFAVTTNGVSNPNIVTSGTMKITFTDGPEISLDNAIPGDTLAKTFSVTNTGNVSTSYDIFLSEIADNFADQSDLAYTITSDKGVNITSDTQLPGSDDSLSTNIAIGVGETHNYTLTIKFLNKNKAQDTNQGKQYSAKVNIIAYDLVEENAVKVKTSNFNYTYNTIALLDGVTVTQIPANDGTVVATNTTCDNNVTGTWDNEKWGLFLTNINNNNTTCTINFATILKYDYTGSEQTLTISKTGYYILETWGAQGGTYNSSYYGGYGAYSTGLVYLERGAVVYINVGGAGGYVINSNGLINGGYNGGGKAKSTRGSGYSAGAGGGATSISKASGLLSTFSANKSAVLIVAGGGGGAGYSPINYATFYGGHAGGITGSKSTGSSTNWSVVFSYGGTQTAGGTGGALNGDAGSPAGVFGSGAQAIPALTGDGGGGGWYGGGTGNDTGGGGGSSYIGNPLLLSSTSYIKHMTGYNCSTSSVDSTKTNTTKNVSATATIDYAKIGNGYAAILFAGTSLD